MSPDPRRSLTRQPALLDAADPFVRRHIGPGEDEVRAMLDAVGAASLDALLDAAVPETIRRRRPLDLPEPLSEHEMLRELQRIASRNRVVRSYIGQGYSDCVTPAVILRNVLENPGWYTAYTPYQPEIAQGRLEALLNYQTMIVDLTGLDIANASLLDEGTAAAEAMAMSLAAVGDDNRRTFFVSERSHPQTIDVVRTRAGLRGVEVIVGDHETFAFSECVFGALVQYPDTEGEVCDFRSLCDRAHAAGALVTAAADLLALVVLAPPGQWGADIAVGSTQRFGVPMGYGGPHAAYFATRDAHKRRMPGRLVGVSKDAQGRDAIRLSLQTREQHIRREKATSNICTAQVLLAVMAGMYAVYHGPEGLRRIAFRVQALTDALAEGLRRLGHRPVHERFFDTIVLDERDRDVAALRVRAEERGMNLRYYADGRVGISLDETTGSQDVAELWAVVHGSDAPFTPAEIAPKAAPGRPEDLARRTDLLAHPVFHRYRSETEMMRYLKRLESRDLALNTSMIPLGSCTMKANAAAEMLPITWPEFAGLHPFAPPDQADGYAVLTGDLERWLCEITGFARASFQPNSGAQGEFTGLLVIRRHHAASGQGHRDVCLIPASAHGTNPASAAMAGLEVVVVATDADGNIDVADLRARAAEHGDRLAALMVTYPSTHGIFEAAIREVCDVVHAHGGQVYLDGANMNAMVAVCRPADLGADVCHLNLHKTFAIPHGGGGPGMGPICVAKHLAPHLPGHVAAAGAPGEARGAVSAAPLGSASILPISWAYVRMLGSEGLRRATAVAILNANYMARRLDAHYPVLYKGAGGYVAHECIIDPRPLKAATGVSETDIAKRLMDYGFHASTVSFPVPGTLMIEPTESESKAELDRFCDALIAIREEIRQVETGQADPEHNALKGAPHTAAAVSADEWDRPYPRSLAAYPAPWTREHKFWPSVGRIDEPYGDRHLMCTCPPMDTYRED